MQAIEIYFAAGVATSPLFMDRFREVVHAALADAGFQVRSELAFPYGDRERSLIVQLREVGRDLRLRGDRLDRSIGGQRLLAAIEDKRHAIDSAGDSRTLVLIGHSAGGLASVHAAKVLYERQGGKPPLVVMIGSPRCRIPEALRGSVLYLYADAGSRRSDPITRFGSFGGWHTGRWRLPRWQADRYAPIHTSGLRLIGGHADYFRELPPFVNADGHSNLALTTDAVLRWLREKLP